MLSFTRNYRSTLEDLFCADEFTKEQFQRMRAYLRQHLNKNAKNILTFYRQDTLSHQPDSVLRWLSLVETNRPITAWPCPPVILCRESTSSKSGKALPLTNSKLLFNVSSGLVALKINPLGQLLVASCQLFVPGN